MAPYRQDLSKASGGTITGRGGNVQQLGAAAQRRLAAGQPAGSAPAPIAKPAAMPPLATTGGTISNPLDGGMTKPYMGDIGFDMPRPMPFPGFRGGMASYLNPPEQMDGMGGAAGPAGPVGKMPFDPATATANIGQALQNQAGGGLFKPLPGGAPAGPGPLQSPPGGQAGRLAAILARVGRSAPAAQAA